MRKRLKKAISERKNEKERYVLHFDVETSKYLNEIEFVNFNEALKLYKQAIPLSKSDRIELIFSPNMNGEDNVLIMSK